MNQIQNDLVAAQNEVRKELYAPLITAPSSYHANVNLALEKKSYFQELNQASAGSLKLLDDAAEFIPAIGQAWGVIKIFYDPRVEELIAKPAEKDFLKLINQEIHKLHSELIQRYADSTQIEKSIRRDWNLNEARKRLRTYNANAANIGLIRIPRNG